MELFSNPIALAVIGSDRHVLYRCECKQLKPVTKLYFCRHCTKLRCAKCVTHEVDSYYCPNCLENMPSTEAKIKRNRCANCFDCPSCGHSLSVCATAVPGTTVNPLDDPQKAAPAKKMHYLKCGFCRWTTRDVGLPDQATPSGGWGEPELPFAKKMSALLEYYKHVAHQDKIEKARQKITKRRTNMYLMDRYGYALSLGKKRAGSIGSSPGMLSKSNSSAKEMTAPCVTTIMEDIEPIPDSFYTEPVVLEEVLTLDQRFKDTALQPAKEKELYPSHRHLKVRRSQRCKECEHNLCKPEFNPSSIKFKIQLGGMQYCPIMEIKNVGNFAQGEETEVILSVTNPLDAVMNIMFLPTGENDQYVDTKTAEIELPTSTIPIAAKDATVEFDGIGTTSTDNFDDDPKIIHNRSSNKVSLYAKVTPLRDVGQVTVVFNLTYDYKMVTAPIIRKLEESSGEKNKLEEQVVSLTIPVQINFGEITQTLC